MKRTALFLAVLLALAVPLVPAFAGEDTASSAAPNPDDSVFGRGNCAVTVLPAPARDAMSLGDALAARATHREFSDEPLSEQELSDLLWAANGINRSDEGKRTAPTAINRQEIDIYVCRANGAWKWSGNLLRMVSSEDLRGFTGRMNAGADNFAVKAPVALVYVVDFARQGMQDRPNDALRYAAVDCGFVGQNVYLHCAANGLNTVFLGSLDAERIAKALGLPPTSVPLFAQTVGHPAE